MKKIKQTLSLPILYYLRFWAKLQLKKISPEIIAITGSAGKTSTKRATTIVLSDLGRIKESKKANSESGIPLDILGLQPINYSILDWIRLLILAPIKYISNWKHYTHYVVELGIDSPDRPKNMEYLLTILKPHVGVVLNASLVHSANFDKLTQDKNPQRRRQKILREIAQEKGKLVTTMSFNHTAILNADQQEILDLKKSTKAHTLTFGKKPSSDLQIQNIKSQKGNFHFSFTFNNQTYSLTLKNTTLEENYTSTFAASILIATVFDIEPAQAIKNLEKSFTPPPGRWSIFPGIKSTTLIDSSYNASPLTLKKALQDLSSLSGQNRKLAVIGDMRELGVQAKQAHKNLSSWIVENSNEAFLFGDLTKKYTLPILQNKNFPVQHFSQMENLIEKLKISLSKNSWILFKGSQNTIFLERAVEALLANKKDSKKLCRRGRYWDKIRSKIS